MIRRKKLLTSSVGSELWRTAEQERRGDCSGLRPPRHLLAYSSSPRLFFEQIRLSSASSHLELTSTGSRPRKRPPASTDPTPMVPSPTGALRLLRLALSLTGTFLLHCGQVLLNGKSFFPRVWSVIGELAFAGGESRGRRKGSCSTGDRGCTRLAGPIASLHRPGKVYLWKGEVLGGWRLSGIAS